MTEKYTLPIFCASEKLVKQVIRILDYHGIDSKYAGRFVLVEESYPIKTLQKLLNEVGFVVSKIKLKQQKSYGLIVKG